MRGELQTETMLLESGNKTNFYFQSSLCSEGWYHYSYGGVNLDEIFHHLSFYDNETNFVFKITNTISNITENIWEDHCVYYQSNNTWGVVQLEQNNWSTLGYRGYLNVVIEIDESIFTDSYWGTTNEE